MNIGREIIANAIFGSSTGATTEGGSQNTGVSSVMNKTFLNRSSGDVMEIDVSGKEGYPVTMAVRVLQAGDIGVIKASHEFSNANEDNFFYDEGSISFEDGVHNLNYFNEVVNGTPLTSKKLYTYDLSNYKYKKIGGA